MKKLTKDYRESLLESLKDPAEAAEYLNAALEEGDSQVLMVALRDVVDAQQDLSRLAKTSGSTVKTCIVRCPKVIRASRV